MRSQVEPVAPRGGILADPRRARRAPGRGDSICIHAASVVLALLFLLVAASAARAAGEVPIPVTVAGSAGSVTRIQHWALQTSAKAQDGGEAISDPGYAASHWLPVTGESTVMAGLLENGRYPDVFHGLEMQRAGRRHFEVPWWYRAQVRLSDAGDGLHTFIRINGVIPAADVWLNGHQVASRETVAGAYAVHTLDVTRWIHAGLNTLALAVPPTNPQRDLALGWIDWNPAAPDNDMGIWRGVDIVRTGPVSLQGLHVLTRLALPGMRHADLTVKARLVNHTARTQVVGVRGEVAGIALSRKVRLGPHAVAALVFDRRNSPGLRIGRPQVWWPAGMGAHPLYHAELAVDVGATVSDRATTDFGIRDVRAILTPQGYRQFVVNGQPVLIRGGGWASDLFLRDQPQRLAAEFAYIRNLGLNAIRSEGKLERPDFYRLADRNGIMVLAGWECCDKWEAWARTGGEAWNARDLAIATASMASEARALRDHPSVIAFLIGSDNAPPPPVAKAYVDALHAADWPDAIISAASDQATAAAGPSGMKMSGPYAWVPPNYWYADRLGGAFGFNSETSAGVDIPTLRSLERMLTPLELEALWKHPDVRQYHAAPFWSPFSSLDRFDAALARRYGAPKDLRDYVEKAQLANYEAVRAQFEAYSAHMDAARPSTGVIYWMLENAWPSLHWHLIAHDLDPAGAYFGAQKANEPVHIQYAYDDGAIVVVNHTLTAERGLAALVRVRAIDGTVRWSHRVADIDLPAHHTDPIGSIPKLDGLSRTYFVELELNDADGRTISRNVYWLSATPDRLDWPRSTGFVTPVSSWADYGALQDLAPATVATTVAPARDGDDAVYTVTLRVPPDSKAPALFVHLSVRASGSGKRILPILWSGNDLTLWPGESASVTARFTAGSGAPPVVQVQGWNVVAATVEAGSGKFPAGLHAAP